MAIELDAAAVGLDQPGDHVEHGGLAGAVGTQQADRLAAAHMDADALDDFPPEKLFSTPWTARKPSRLAGAAPLPSARAAAPSRILILRLRALILLGRRGWLTRRLRAQLILRRQLGGLGRLGRLARRPRHGLGADLVVPRRRARDVDIGAVYGAAHAREVDGSVPRGRFALPWGWGRSRTPAKI